MGCRLAATCPTFPTLNGIRAKCPCRKHQSSPGELMGVPALATRQRSSGRSDPVWHELGRSADGSSQIRANATPGCAANPKTILCKTESTLCSEVTVTAKASSGSAASEVPTNPPRFVCDAFWPNSNVTNYPPSRPVEPLESRERYLGIDLHLTTAIDRFDIKLLPIPLSNCFFCATLV